MRLPADISSVYFLGIGGIGMSALARMFHARGIYVSGYDRTQNEFTQQLASEGISIHYTDDPSLIDQNASLVIYTPAIPADHKELNWLKENNTRLYKRSEVLGMLTADTYNICIAGTHGKTTTSAMVAHLLTATDTACNAYLGGIAANYDSNFIGGGAKISVVEADEYDRSFLQLSPDRAVITAMDADHLDIYGTEEKMQEAFIEFTTRIRRGGKLYVQARVQRKADFVADEVLRYSATTTTADVFVKNLRVHEGAYEFDLFTPDWSVSGLRLNMGGRHNLENAAAALAVSYPLAKNKDKIREALASFKGVKRRFEFICRHDDFIFIDDYAHHPEELRALINGAKELFPGKKITVVFQPHLFSRTRDLAAGFAEVLSIPDETMLLPIYPARELPMEGVNSEMILAGMTNANRIVSKSELVNELADSKLEILITAGAGDIDALVQPLREHLCKAKDSK